MTDLQVKLDTTNKLATKQYSNHTRREAVVKELFETVYVWGRVGYKVDENAPAYRELINKLLKI